MTNNLNALKIPFVFLLFPVFIHAAAVETVGIEVWGNHKIIQTTAQKMEYLPVIKAGKDGGIYITEDPMRIEDRKVEMNDLPAVLAKLRKKYDTIAYFREEVFKEPRGKYLRHIREILDKLELADFNIRMGDNYLGQYGEITGFTLYIGPGKLRFSADRGRNIVYAFAPPGKKKMKVYTKDVSGPEAWKEAEKNLSMIFHSSRLAGMEQKNRDLAFMPDEMKMSSVHIRVVIDGKHEWRAYYNMDEVPQNVRSLIEDCKIMGKRYIK